ncbi:hypothetical protein KFK09_013659 [Dendrobium nobile]|uniref:Uncharacterized protein n=1 Tax=Dendrobium nobile TaxID=94219 RepID=A0A8T3B7Y7_DENNO|nr:hypothetical protein KFK09_013659 [Dendrobium nobile]
MHIFTKQNTLLLTFAHFSLSKIILCIFLFKTLSYTSIFKAPFNTQIPFLRHKSFTIPNHRNSTFKTNQFTSILNTFYYSTFTYTTHKFHISESTNPTYYFSYVSSFQSKILFIFQQSSFTLPFINYTLNFSFKQNTFHFHNSFQHIPFTFKNNIYFTLQISTIPFRKNIHKFHYISTFKHSHTYKFYLFKMNIFFLKQSNFILPFKKHTLNFLFFKKKKNFTHSHTLYFKTNTFHLPNSIHFLFNIHFVYFPTQIHTTRFTHFVLPKISYITFPYLYLKMLAIGH